MVEPTHTLPRDWRYSLSYPEEVIIGNPFEELLFEFFSNLHINSSFTTLQSYPTFYSNNSFHILHNTHLHPKHEEAKGAKEEVAPAPIPAPAPLHQHSQLDQLVERYNSQKLMEPKPQAPQHQPLLVLMVHPILVALEVDNNRVRGRESKGRDVEASLDEPNEQAIECRVWQGCKHSMDEPNVLGKEMRKKGGFNFRLTYRYDLPVIKENFVYFREDYCNLDLVKGSSYSYDLGLVPIKIHFKINHLVQNGTLIGQNLDENFFNLVNPFSIGKNLIERALEKMAYLKSSCFCPAKCPQEQYEKLLRSKNRSISGSISLDDGLVYVHRVQVTPTKVYFSCPKINVSNRVVHNYTKEINNFIRVSFRILSMLRNGITIGDKKFEFLAFSASQLWENSAWMFASSNGVTAVGIRYWMRNFRIKRNVDKYAARLGQSFGNIENSAGYIFSDGIDKISSKFSRTVAIKCGLKSVVVVDPMLVRKLSLWNSMCKYEYENFKLDILEILMCGYKPDVEPFLSMISQTYRASKFFELRTKSRVYVPKSRAMMGCLDETRILEYGKVVVTKNPSLHPSDFRILNDVDVPDLYHMVDYVVYPQNDLDGDLYFVCWDPELIPPSQASPMEYTAAPSETLDRVILNAHMVFTDREPMKAHSPPYIKLSKLFSIAMDFPKIGVPAEIPPHLYVKEYPNFIENPDKVTYISKGVIGKLFRAVKDHFPQGKRSYDPDMEVDCFMDYTDDAMFFKENNNFKMGNLMEHFGMMNVAELLYGSLMKVSRKFNKYKDGEADRLAGKSLRKEARAWLDEDNDRGKSAASYVNASVCYHVINHKDYWGTYNEGVKRLPFIIFRWCANDKLITIKK
ncbi:hypothetical protein KFK09_008623 [Dendrobium nobile]|uniref:RNA-dependent RNA polymerase n=1 Tax=Dendrobium nobile TaxID=94219 RepID=A0A8T3BPF0_DENNO|nr:hypothetical protein KFK09_008623 [Dendrobium nobile]